MLLIPNCRRYVAGNPSGNKIDPLQRHSRADGNPDLNGNSGDSRNYLVSDIARTKGMAQVASDAGLSRESPKRHHRERGFQASIRS